ncbi:MAG TPA: tetratricopeptide repeat protein [Pyrinomonadaceae bacterium]
MIESVVLMMLLTADAPPVSSAASPTAPAISGSMFVQGQSSISGTIVNQQRRPVENVRVELLDDVDGVLATTYTNGSGRYAFYRLSTGNFQVRVLTVGTDYETKTERVAITGSVLGGRGSQSEQLDIMLSLKKRRGSATMSGGTPGTVFVQEVPQDARKAYDQALKDLDGDKSKEKALMNLQRAIELFPNYYAALDRLGQEFVKRGNYDQAQPLLTKALTINPRSASSWYALGYAQYKLRLLPAATESLTKSVSYNPDSISTYLVLGTAKRMQRQWGEAETHLTRAKSMSKESPIAEIHWQLAILYNQMSRFAAAADELELFLKAQPDSRDEVKIRRLIGELRKKK